MPDDFASLQAAIDELQEKLYALRKAKPGTAAKVEAAEDVEEAEEKVEAAAERAGLTDEECDRIAARVWAQIETNLAADDETEGAEGVEEEKTDAESEPPVSGEQAGGALGKLRDRAAAGDEPEPESKPAASEDGDGAGAKPKPDEAPGADKPPAPQHWSERTVFGRRG